MLSALIIFTVCYALTIAMVVIPGFYSQVKKEVNYSNEKTTIDLKEVVVLVPFRNEEKRLSDLISAINQSKELPNRFIFINDHSTDQGVDYLRSGLRIDNYLILNAPDDCKGKKRALRYATQQSNERYILTMDADISFDQEYFSRISKLGESDMYLLPVIMKPLRWFEYFFEIDLILVSALNMSLAGLKRPIIASGANLLYSRKSFDKFDNLSSHIHMASGDDTYLLRDYRQNNANVRLVSIPEIAVTTETPQSIREFIDQRIRWISKTTDIKDSLSTFIAVFQFLLTLAFFILLVVFLVKSQFLLLGILLLLKTLIDMTIFIPYFFRMRRFKSWIFIPFYELFFPVYTLMILVLMPFYKPKWKGRTIYN